MSKWLLGVDAGGTRTRVLAVDAASGERRSGVAEAANWTVHGGAVCRERISAAVRAALPEGADSAALCLCIAGYYPPDHAGELQRWLCATWPGAAVAASTDLCGAWAGAHGGEAGIVLISGTGSVCYGRAADGREARAGGWGPLFSDQGSAYDIGVRCLRALADSVDGLQEATTLAGRLLDRWPGLGADAGSWLRGVYRANWGREEVAALAIEVDAAARGGDRVAAEILEGAADDLMRMAMAVERRLGQGQPLALCGGVLENSQWASAALRRRLAAAGSTLRVTESRLSPVEGAALLAAEALGGPVERGRICRLLGKKCP